MNYDAYAPIYDTTAQDTWSAKQATWTLDWLRKRGVMPASVLDLACGTGGAALMFASAGCHVVGVDRSAAMLEIARGKVRDAGADVTFVQADVQLTTDDRRQTTDQKNIHRPYNLVTCFDALNEITAGGDLERICTAVAAALQPSGWFVFDMPDPDVLTEDERDVVVSNNTDCVVYHRFSHDEETGITTRRVVWLVREIERWWRGEETHTLRTWSRNDIQTALATAGLHIVEQHNHAERMIYVARREE